MENNIFKRIVQWNKDRDNLQFKHFTETKMLAEELFEFCGYSREEAKQNGKEFAFDYSNIHLTEDNKIVYSLDEVLTDSSTKLVLDVTKSDLADALGDLIYIAVGGIAKLGYDPEEVMTRICNHNDAKGSKKDADGKIIKDETFVEPVH